MFYMERTEMITIKYDPKTYINFSENFNLERFVLGYFNKLFCAMPSSEIC